MKYNVYEEAIVILDDFVKNKISNYSKLRNYDYGLVNPIKGVSGLSHFISKGIIREYSILNYIKKNKVSSEKYIQEILWRTYWKGWLESHKEVWDKYKIIYLSNLKILLLMSNMIFMIKLSMAKPK